MKKQGRKRFSPRFQALGAFALVALASACSAPSPQATRSPGRHLAVAGTATPGAIIPAPGDLNVQAPEPSPTPTVIPPPPPPAPLPSSAAPAPLPAPTADASKRVLNVPYFHQQYHLSCEAAGVQGALAYQGITASQDTILAHMAIDDRPAQTDSNGNLVKWGNAYTNFVGDPSKQETGYGGYGVYYPRTATAAQELGGKVLTSGTGIAPSQVYAAILAGHPVLAWFTIDWAYHPLTSYTSFDGQKIPYMQHYEHASTIIGVSSTSVLVNNTWTSPEWVSKATFEASYAQFSNMAIIFQ